MRKVTKLGASSVGASLATKTMIRCEGHPRALFILAVEYHCADDPNTPVYPERLVEPGLWHFRRESSGEIATGSKAMLEITGGSKSKHASLAICALMEPAYLEVVGKHRDGSARHKKHPAAVSRSPAECVAHILRLLKSPSIGELLKRDDFKPSISNSCLRLETMWESTIASHLERLGGAPPVVAFPRRHIEPWGAFDPQTTKLPLRLVNTAFFASCSGNNHEELVGLRELIGISEAIRVTGLAALRFY